MWIHVLSCALERSNNEGKFLFVEYRKSANQNTINKPRISIFSIILLLTRFTAILKLFGHLWSFKFTLSLSISVFHLVSLCIFSLGHSVSQSQCLSVTLCYCLKLYPSLCIYVCMSTPLSLSLSLCLCVFLSMCLCVCLFLSLCLLVSIPLCLLASLSPCLSVSLPLCLLASLSLCLSVYMPLCLYASLSLCLPVALSHYLGVAMSLCF